MISRLAIGVLLLAGCIGAHGQDTVWRSAWYTMGQAGFYFDDVSVLGTSTGQFVYYGGIYGWDWQVTSITPSGVVNWQVDVPEFEGGVVAGTDGSVFFGATKIDASGHIVWYRNDLGARALTLTSDALYLGSCVGLASLDIDTGATRWSVDRGPSAHCISSMGSDAGGNVYLVSQLNGPPYTPTPPVRFAKYDSTGSLKWDISITTTQIGTNFVGASDGRVFINQGPDFAAYDALSGALLWTYRQATGQLMAGVPASPITGDSGGTHKLDPADGHIQWTRSFVGGLAGSAVQGNGIYTCSSKIDASTGNTVWSYNTNFYNCFQPILSAGTVLSSTLDYVSGALSVDSLDATSGALVSQSLAAATPQGMQTRDSFVDQGHIVQVGGVANSQSNNRLRSIDATTGAVEWDVAFTTPLTRWGPYLGRSSDSIIVTSYSGYGSFNTADYWIGSFARSDGSLRWSVTEYETGNSYVWGSTPLTDSQGNVFVSYTGWGACQFNPNNQCYTVTLMKLAAADGSVLWHFDSLLDGENAPPFTLIGDDVLLAGGFSAPLAGNNIVRLSGSDGSVLWSAAPFDNDASTAVAVNPDGTILLTGSSTRALLQTTGSIVWTDHPTIPCSPNCAVDDQVQLADGTILFVGGVTDPNNNAITGWVGSRPLVQYAPTQHASVDADAPADVKALPLQIAAGTGGVWIAGYMRQPPATHFYFLAKLDPATLAVNDQQVLATYNADSFAPGIGFDILGAPNGNLLPTDIYNLGGGAPPNIGAAVFDTAITARGDLALSLTSADQPTVSTFQATVTYTGDNPITSARLMLWHQGFYDAGALNCATANASNCAVENHSGYVETTFDIQPGGSITVSGSYPASKELSTLYGAVNGPPSLGEPTLGNNFRSTPLGDLLFRNGFE